MFWELTVFLVSMFNGEPSVTTVTLGKYSNYESCSRAAAQEDVYPTVRLIDGTGHMMQRVGLTQCRTAETK